MSLKDKLKRKPEETGPKPMPYPVTRCCNVGFSRQYIRLVIRDNVGGRWTGHGKHQRWIEPYSRVSYPPVAEFFQCWRCQMPTGHDLKIFPEYRTGWRHALWMHMQTSKNYYVQQVADGEIMEYDWSKHPFVMWMNRKPEHRAEMLENLKAVNEEARRKGAIDAYQQELKMPPARPEVENEETPNTPVSEIPFGDGSYPEDFSGSTQEDEF